MLMLDKSLKNNDISVKDYTLAVQNLTDGTNQAFDIVKDWNAEYENKLARMNNCGKKDENGVMIECSAAQEQYEMMQAEALGRLDSHSLFINPSNFKVSLGKRAVDENGNYTGALSNNQNDFAELNQLKNRISRKINKYDLMGNLSNIEKMLSTEYKKVVKRGNVKTVKDARNNPYFKKAIDNYINGMLTNDIEVGSMLTDHLRVNPNTGEPYRFEMDPEIAANDPNAILLVNDPDNKNSGLLVPDFSTTNGKEQFKAAQDMLYYNVQGMLDREETAMIQNTKVEGLNKRLDADADMIAKLYYGTPNEIQMATTYFRDSYDDIKSIKRSDKGIEYTTIGKGGTTTKLIPFEGPGGPFTLAEFMGSAGNLLTGNSDFEDAITRGGYQDDKTPFNKIGEEIIESKVEDKVNLLEVRDNWLEEKMTGEDGIELFQVFTGKPAEIKSDLENRFSDLGLKVDIVTDSDEVEISVPGSRQQPMKFEERFLTKNARKEARKLRDYIRAVTNEKSMLQKLGIRETVEVDELGLPI